MNLPLAVIRYLAELDAALAARNVPDRDQIVTQIGEHIAPASRGLGGPMAATAVHLHARHAYPDAGAARP